MASAAPNHFPDSGSAQTIFTLFEDAAKTYPQSTAIQFETSRQIAYQEAKYMVDLLASSLQGYVAKNQLVPVLLSRSIEQICVVVALAKLGAVYVPLDTGSPDARLCGIVSTIQPKLIVTENGSESRFKEASVPELRHFDPLKYLKEPLKQGQSLSCSTAEIPGPNDLAVVLFTSGSTGEPKGVMLSHRNLIEPVRLLSRMERIDSESKILQFASCAFDVHLIDIFCALFNGATLCQASNDNLSSDLSGWVEKMRADVIHLTPSVISLLDYTAPTTLKYMITCGEPVTRAIIQDWSSKVVLINLFGPCEASSVIATVLHSDSDPKVIGLAASHASIHILDDSGRPVAAGLEGEIYCSGHSVALGYLNDAAGTNRSFRLASSFDVELDCKGEVIYATGDYGVFTDAGELIFLGRRDSQIKVNGQRVDLSEIRRVLAGLATRFYVLPVKDPAGRDRIYSFVSKEKKYSRQPVNLVQDSALIKELYSVCRAALPLYMIPKFVVVSAIPINLSGKIDERSLSQIVKARLHTHSECVMSTVVDKPLQTTEGLQGTLAAIVGRRFSGNIPSIDDDLISYGLTSLDFMVFIKDVKTTFDVSLTFRQVFSNPDIRTITKILKERMLQTHLVRDIQTDRSSSLHQAADERETKSVKAPETCWVQPSAGQEMMFSAQNVLRNHAYNCNFVLRIESFPLDPEILISALKCVCSRHEILRSTYHDALSNPQAETHITTPICRQKIHERGKLGPVCRVNLPDPSREGSHEETTLASIEKEAAIVFNLGNDSPVRMTIYQLSMSGDNWMIHFNIHHIAIDEWGFENLCRELESAYRALQLDDGSLSVVAEPLQYSEFSRCYQTGDARNQQHERLKWWLRNIDTETSEYFLSELHVHTPSEFLTRIEDDQSLVHTRTLDLKQVRLFEAKACEGSTPFIAWLTLCQIVLARMTRKAKFALAVPVTNRGMDPRFQDVVGFCLNTLLVPVELTSKDTFESSIRTTQRTFDACVANSLPLGIVVEALLKERSMTGKFMPEVMFVYHDSNSNPSTGMEGTSPNFLQGAERIQLPSVGSRFDLVIHFSKKHPDTPQLTFEFRRSLFSQDFVEAMARCFETALCDIIAEGNQKPYGQITCLSTIDEALILEWSSPPPLSESMTATWVQGHGCLLHQLVESTALKAPQAMAVVTKSGYTLTYAELIAKARVLCQWLRANGLTHQMTTVLLLNLSVELVVARLAVLMGGGTFVALDPQHKVAINQAKVEVSCPGMVIFNSATAPTLGSLRLEENVRSVNISLSTDSTPAQSDIRITVTEDAYLCFTSGSTGDAKFFPISHAAAAASIMSHIERFQLGIGDRVGMVCNTTFDVSVLETFAALAAGAVLCIGSQDEILTDLAHTLNSLAISHIFATPTLVSLLEGPAQVPSLRFVALLGEPTTVKLFELWARSVDLQNAYGPAEVALNTHSRSFSSTDDKSRVMQRIGTSMPSVRSYVLDIDGNLTLPGCVGHLNIGDCDPGKLGHLSRGYITPAAANIRYTSHPKFGRLYNTGDLCFYTFDGELNLLGREDDQIKLHGVRMNLGDIERTVQGNANQQVAAAVCEISESSNSEQAIALFVNFPSSEYVPDVARAYSTCPWLLTLSPEIREPLRELRLQAAEKLADVMVPKFWLPVNTFARNDNGKMDRKAIKSWAAEFSSFNRKSEYAILSSPEATTQGVKRLRKTWLGKILIDTWKGMFRLSDDEIDVGTAFLHVGGDSISAIRYVSSLRSKEVVGCTVSRLYDSPTLSRLHDALQPLQVPRSSPVPSDIKSSVSDGNRTRRFLRNMPDSKTRNALVADALGISETVIKQVYPTTSMQRAMLLQTESHPELYITQVILSLQGKLDIERMSSAWHAVCSAHPTMHTTFVRILSGDELSFFAVEVKPSALFSPPRISQRPILSDTLGSELKVERERIFKLGGTMFRLLIAEGEEQAHKLILSCHHSSCDGWSLDIILRSLANAYQGHPLLPTPSFSEMVSFDAEQDKSEAKLFWKTYLQNYSPTSLMWNLTNPRLVKMKAAERVMTSISASSLSRFAKQRSVTPAVIMQAAWSVLLSNMMGTDDVAFGVVVSGRDVEVNNVVEMAGNFLNTIPLRVYVDRSSDLSQWLQHIHQSSIKSLEHHHLSLEEMMRQSDGPRIFETVFIFENQAIRLDKSAFGSLHLERIDGREFSEIPLTLVLEFVDDGLMVTVKFNNAIFPVLQIETMIDNYLDILSNILAKATMAKLGRSEPYDELLYVKELLGSLSIQARDTNNDTLVSYFTQSAQLFLDKIAIEEDACSVTFSELSTRSDTVRDFIAQAGLRNNQVVPILFSHSIDMVVAMLGIMKAGAAYCPIDVDAPEGKIRYVVEKVAARVIVGDADYRKKVSNTFLAEFDFVSIREIEQMRTKPGTKASAVGLSVTPQDPCYVLFTSGSTGLPKGCILTHSAALNAVLQTSSKTQITEVSRVLLFANYVFDASVIDIFGSLLTGGTLCISSRTRLLSGLQKVILDRQISHIHLTPSVAQVLSAGSCPSLKTLVIGGERMVPTLRDRWADRVKLFDGYGPTECAIQVSTTLVSPSSDIGIISESLPGNMIILLDRQGEIPRVGEVGEICIGGHQVFSGYIGEPKATERALRHSPIFKSRFFGTGDLGRYRRDMTIQLLGRKDTQVKLLGERVEVEEIESIICSFKAVERCAVLVEKNQLYAIVEERERTSEPTVKEIEEWCIGSLPSRLVPLVLFWPDLPLTPSNKLDRRAITQRFREMKISSAIGTDHMLNSETEHAIAAMVVKINGHELQDATLPLQHSGLNSLDILHLRSALAERYGFSLALTQFWLAASIRSLAKSIEEKLELPVNSKEEASVATGDTLLASDSQVAIWMAQKSYADSTYNVGSVLHIPNVDPHRLCSSIQNVVQSLDIFRIKFEWNYGLDTLQQRLNLTSNVPVELYDLVNCEKGTAALKRFCGENHKTVFDLECGPLAMFWVLLLDSECYLYYNIHHILVDEWTCEKLTDAFLKEYCGLPWHDGMRPSWNSLMHVWRSESCKDIAMEDWKQNLNGVTTFDTHSWPRGNVANEIRTAGSTSVFKVPLEVLQKIRSDINGDLSSLFISLLCAFQVLLHQYTAQWNQIVLIPVSRRGFDVKSMNSIGNMTHTAAVRSDVESDDTFAKFGGRTARAVAFARENSFVPIDKVLGAVSSTVSEHSVMFVYNKPSVNHSSIPTSDLSRDILPQTFTIFDLTMNVVEDVDGLSVHATFNTRRFAPDFIDRLAGSYLKFLLRLSRSGAEQTLRNLLRHSTSGVHDIERISNTLIPESLIRRSTLLHQAFEARAIESPSSVAIEYLSNGKRTLLCYGELNDKATKLASTLQGSYSIVSGDIVPIFIDQTPDLLVAVIGILKAGAGYTPIPRDGSWPLERVCQILERCQAKVLVSDTDVVPSIEIKTLNVQSALTHPNNPVTCIATPESIAYVLWTSGTTGQPKGIMLSHLAAVSCISSISGRLYPKSNKDRVFQFSSPVFDVSVVDYFATLSMGATLCMMPRAELLNDVQRAVSELKPTAASLTPSVAQLLNPKRAQFKTVILSGEAVTAKVRDMFIGAGTTLINGYGPTEANIVTFTEMNGMKEIQSIGKPLPLALVAVIDNFGNLAPTFVRGEICIGGPQLFSGYLSRVDLTKRAHMVHEKYGRLYKTGDVGFVDAAGNIIFCGRRDTQVKLHGQRVELEEISSVISEMTHIKANAVAVINEQVVAFVVYGTSGETAGMTLVIPHNREDMDEIKKHVKSRMPIVPSRWLRISQVPLTISGKLDMRTLVNLAETHPEDEKETTVGPANDYERKVYDCCLQVLGISIGVTANLLNYGLDSYSGMTLISRLRVVFPNFQLSFRSLMANPVPRRLAVLARNQSILDNTLHSDAANEARADLKGSPRYPTSSMEARFCLAQDVFQDATYNVPGLFEVQSVDIERVRVTLNAMIAEHAIFRTCFEFHPPEGYQQVLIDHLEINVAEYDFSSCHSATVSVELQHTLQSELRIPFDITTLPLLRCNIFRKSDETMLVFVNFHHSIIDAQSLSILMTEFSSRLGRLAQGDPPSTLQRDLGMQYIDYCLEEESRLSDSALMDESIFFWRQHLERMETITFPISPSVLARDSAIATFTKHILVPNSAFAGGRPHGITKFSVFLTYFQITLARCWGCSEPTILIPISQRPTDWGNMYGCFLNTVPIRCSIDTSTSLKSAMQTSNRILHEVMEHSYIPYESIIKAAGLKFDAFPVMFVYHEDRPSLSANLKDCSYIVRNLSKNVKSKFPMTFSITVKREELDCALEVNVDYDPSKISATAVQSFCDRYAVLLLSASKVGESVIVGQLEIMSEAEQNFLKQSQVQLRSKPSLPRIHDLIEQCALDHPNRTACWFEAEIKVTYHDLWTLAKWISELLLPYRFRKESRVAILMEPGIERIATILGALRAGFAYVPLSAEWPTLRIASVVRDSAPEVVLVSSSGTPECLQDLDNALSDSINVEPIICLHDIQDHGENILKELKMPIVDGSHLAYILYTSGSTGAPKGVQVEHGALSSSVDEHCRIYHLSSSSKLLQLAPWTFDVSVIDILGTLSTGATLCIGSKDYFLSRLEEAVNTMEITHLATTPTVAALLAPERCPTLETLAIGGEPMTKAVVEIWSKTLRLLNVYGPTEATVNVTYCRMHPDADVGVIGKPLGNVTAYILDDQLNVVPLGSVGQLAIGGAQLARGYTAKALDEVSFLTHQVFGRVFLTGDLAKFTEDGSIRCFGRRDNQVKLRGQRIELEEIERLIGTKLEIQSVVVSVISTDRGEALCASFSTRGRLDPRTGSHILESNEDTNSLVVRLEDLAKAHLPIYAVPQYWISFSKVPWDAHGKLDRSLVRSIISSMPKEELARFTIQQEDHDATKEPLHSKKEELLGMCFAEVLGVTKLSRSSNFFVLGGDSISAIRLCSVAAHRSLRLMVSDIYKNPTLAKLARVAKDAKILTTESTAESKGTIHNTPVMEWFFLQRKANPNWYNQTCLIKLKFSEDLEKLPRAWQTIIQAHPGLSIRCLDGSSRVELTDPSRKDNFSVIRGQFTSFGGLLDGLVDVTSSLHLATGPISSLGLFQAADEAYCVFCVHHLAIDIVSWQIIFDDLDRLLQGESVLPESGTFQEWSLRLRQQREVVYEKPSPGDLNSSSSHCHTNLRFIPKFEHVAHLNTIATARVAESKVSPELTNLLLTDANRNARTEPVDILLASLLLAFQRWKDISQVEICFESHGRDLKDEALDVSRTVGWFTSMKNVLFSIPPPNGAQLDELIAEVKDCRSFAMRDIDLARPLAIQHDRAPMITFNYSGSYSSNLNNELFELVDIGEGRADEDPANQRFAALDIGCGINNGVLAMSIIYSVSIHSDKEADRLLKLWIDCLNQFLGHYRRATAKCILTSRELPSLQMQRHRIASLVQSSLVPTGIASSMIEDMVPATDMQKSMILASQEFGSYLESFTYRVRGDVEVDSFIAAWSKVVAKYAALRSVFIQCDLENDPLKGEIIQVILSPDYPILFHTSWEARNSLEFTYGKLAMQMCLHQVADGSFQFTWDYHHALIDGWSAEIVKRDFQSAYLARLSPTTTPFEDVRSKMRVSAKDERLRNFWKLELEGVISNRLTDHSQSEISQEESHLDWRCDQTLDCAFQDVAACAATHSTTASTILRAAWALTLAYFYGEEEVVFGATTSGRNIDVPGVEEVVGPCVNTIPFRIRVDGGDSREAYLQKIHSKSALSVENDGLSLHQIYKASGKSDLFDTTFVFQNYAKFPRERDLPFDIDLVQAKETTDIPLNVMVSETSSGQLHVAALMHGEHFSSVFLDNIFAAFSSALEWICDRHGNRKGRIRDLVMLSPAAQRQVEDISRGPNFQQQTLDVWQLFARQEGQISDKPALEFYEGGTIEILSYGKLLRRAERAAQYLHFQGIRSRDRVALYMDKSPALIIIMLSLLRVGATCIPLRFGIPEERIERLMQEAVPKHSILFGKHAGNFAASWNLLHVEEILEWQSSDSAIPPSSQTPDDCAMILFTSGTTGVPKGVLMPNRQVAGYAVTMAEAYRYDRDSRIFAFSSYAFDVFISDVFGGLSAGAVLCIAALDSTMGDLVGLLNASRSTHINLTSSVASMLDPRKLAHLRSVVLTGEPATKKLFQTWASRIHVVNSYGPTEAAVITWTNVNPHQDPHCVGKAVRGMEVMILNDSLKRVPVGVQGTIYTSGNQLSLGYLNRPELTKKLFMPNPYSPGKLMYNTGDLGAFDLSGRVLCFGRKDQQVKIHGQRIELEEVEAALGQYSRIAAITIFDYDISQTRLVAFFEIELSTGNGLDTETFRSAEARNTAWKLEKRAHSMLPSFMVPSVFIPIKHLPITANRKIDRAKLQELYLRDYLPHSLARRGLTQPLEPMSVTETKLCEAIGELFGVSTISVNMDLFSGVLDSLSSMSLTAHLRTIFTRPIRLQWILEARTIRSLASRIDCYRLDEDVGQADQMPEHALKIPPTIMFSHSAVQNIFCIHPASGLSYVFHEVALHLPDLNVIGVNDPCYGDVDAYQDVHGMAKVYLGSIFKHQPGGHFVLLGYSFGAHVATEMARLLREQNQTVQLILVDSSVEKGANERFKTPEIAESVYNSFKINVDKSIQSVEEQGFLQNLKREVARNLRLMTDYHMNYFPWEATFLRAYDDVNEEEFSNRDTSNGYRVLVKDLIVERISGNHYEVFSKENVSCNAAVLRKILKIDSQSLF